MSNYFIVHGSFGKPFENWFPWLEKNLSERKIDCFVPHFPTPKNQNYSNWGKLLDYYLKLGQINESTVFITHSSASVFVVKYIIENKVKIKGLISVSGYNNYLSGMKEFDDVNNSFFIDNHDISKINNYIKFIHCYISDNDPYLPMEKLKEFAILLKANLHIIPNAGHFNTTAGYIEFKELFDLIKGIEKI
jgi:hypothetical protein